jgi:hypothetical protein
MTATLSLLHTGFTVQSLDHDTACADTGPNHGRDDWPLEDEQIGGLVRRVFLPGWPKPSRHVVFTAADDQIDIGPLCQRTGELLVAEGAGRVALVEADFRSHAMDEVLEEASHGWGDSSKSGAGVRQASHQTDKDLWVVPANTFLGRSENLHNAIWLRSRLGELRREFEYSLIHAPSCAHLESTALLAHLSDGVVLTLDAHRTRRMTAIRIRDHLVSLNARLLGIVLRDRRFPIPETIYRRV